MKCYLTINLNPTYGEHLVGYFEYNELNIKEVHRFPINYIILDDKSIWDLDDLFIQIIKGLRKAVIEFGKIESIHITSSINDYVLMIQDFPILPCIATNIQYDYKKNVLFNEMKQQLYSLLGYSYNNPIIYRLLNDSENSKLTYANNFLMIAEYLIFKLTQEKHKDLSLASLSGLVNLDTLDYDSKTISKLHLPKKIFSDIDKKPIVINTLSNEVMKVVGLNIPLIIGNNNQVTQAYDIVLDDSIILNIDSSIHLAVKIDNPIKTTEAMENGFSNILGVDKLYFEKELMGLFILQKLQKEIKVIYERMIPLAKQTSEFVLFDCNNLDFYKNKDMIDCIKDKIGEVNNSVLVNSVFHSIGKSISDAVNTLSRIVNKKYTKISIIGIGAKNKYLIELIEQYVNLEVNIVSSNPFIEGSIRFQKTIMENYQPITKKNIFNIFKKS